jgi:hypothetical protein
VLTDPLRFDFPTDVSRRAAPRAGEVAARGRSPHSITPPLTPDVVASGLSVFEVEMLEAATVVSSAGTADAMVLLRDPVARSTTAAVLPHLAVGPRDRIAGLCLSWIDALGPVIAAPRPPGRWSRSRRAETRARHELEAALGEHDCADPSAVATVLAAGTQVPIAAGAWLLVKLAEDPAMAERVRRRTDLARAVAWETVRLCPPTWITARVTRHPVTMGEVEIPEGAAVMVSPLLLGRSEALVPNGTGSQLADFDPERWDQQQVRPGAWLPFGAGPHACPGRNLGLAQLTHLATWAAVWKLTVVEPVRVDQSRGLFPRPARLGFEPC